jgi:hypothetical protein
MAAAAAVGMPEGFCQEMADQGSEAVVVAAALAAQTAHQQEPVALVALVTSFLNFTNLDSSRGPIGVGGAMRVAEFPIGVRVHLLQSLRPC